MFEWDEDKRLLTLEKHGVDFMDAIEIFTGPVLLAEDRRHDYGERRFRAIGMVGEEVLLVVFTPRGLARRIISARGATDEEASHYHAYLRRRR